MDSYSNDYRNNSYYYASLYYALQTLHFNKLMVCGNPALSKSISTTEQIYQHHFSPILFAHFMSPCHILVLLLLFQTFPIIFVIVICDQWHPWCYYCNLGRTMNLAHIRQTHINKCCMCSDFSTDQLFPHLTPPPWASLVLETEEYRN